MKSESMKEHKNKAPKSVNGVVITLSDSKYKDYQKKENNDISGKIIKDTLKKQHNLVFYTIIPDEADILISKVNQILKDYDVDVILTTGGTGIGTRDITVETLKKIFDK